MMKNNKEKLLQELKRLKDTEWYKNANGFVFRKEALQVVENLIERTLTDD